MKVFKIAVSLFVISIQAYSQSFDAEILTKSTRITVDNEKIITEENIRIQVKKRTTESRFSDVEIFHQENEKISSLEGWIEDANGNVIRELQKKDISEAHAQTGISFYDDSYIISFSLRHNNYPYYICYSYKKTTPDYLIISSWSPVFLSDVPTREATLELIVPEGFKFNYEAAGVSDPSVEKLKSATSYRWTAKYEKPVLHEVCSPSLISLLPNVKITPDTFHYDAPGSFKNWKTYGKWYSMLLEGINELPAGELIKIKEMVKDAATDRAKASILYHYLQDNTRYINVSTDFGGHKPMSAQYVAENKYGDCKALVNYTKSMLEAVGVSSFYTVVFAGDDPIKSEKGIPFPNFNHVILMIPDENDTIWLECTDKTMPFDYLGTFTSNRKALVINNDNSTFVNTPVLSMNEVETIRRFDLKINGVGFLSFDGEFLLRGDDFETFLNIKSSYDPKQQKMLLDKYLSYSGLEVTNYNISRANRDDKDMIFTLSGNANRFTRKIQGDFIISAVPFDLPDFESPAKRKLPVSIMMPVAKKDSITLMMDPGLYINLLPEDVAIENEFGSYRRSTKVAGNNILLVKELYIAPGDYQLEKYPSFYSFIMAVIKAEKACGFLISNSPKK